MLRILIFKTKMCKTYSRCYPFKLIKRIVWHPVPIQSVITDAQYEYSFGECQKFLFGLEKLISLLSYQILATTYQYIVYNLEIH